MAPSSCQRSALLDGLLDASWLWQVVAYGISINLVEVTWKSKIKAQFPNPNEYSSFMGDFSSATGAVTFVMMLLSRTIFKKYGWGVAALITPTVLLITGQRSACLLCHLHASFLCVMFCAIVTITGVRCCNGIYLCLPCSSELPKKAIQCLLLPLLPTCLYQASKALLHNVLLLLLQV